MPRRASRCTAGTCRYSRFSMSEIVRSRRGTTQAGVRWNSTRRCTTGWIFGTIWIEEAPVPTTATRFPARSKSWFHRAEWKTAPEKSASPGTSGRDGSDSGPAAQMSTSAVSSPRLVRSRHRAPPAAQSARISSVPKAVPVGDVLQVAPDLRLPGETVRPVRVGRERERVQVRRDVAGTPGIGVVAPGAADRAGPFQDDEVGHPGGAQPDARADTAEAGADDGHAHVARQRRRGGRPGGSQPG